MEEFESKLVGEVPGDKEKLLYESCFHPEEEAIYFRVGTWDKHLLL